MRTFNTTLLSVAFTYALLCYPGVGVLRAEPSPAEFAHPTAAARPWVYWFWMDGNLSREGITADLEAMSKTGIGGMIIMEVDVGIPRGPVKFMSDEWRALFKHAVKEAERLGLEITLNAGPGWTGSGGPWVKPEQSMQHIVASSTQVAGPSAAAVVLPRPAPREPHFVHVPLPPAIAKVRDEFYQDIAVLAFPTPAGDERIAESDEKALYYRMPYSSSPGVKPFLAAPAEFAALPPGTMIARDRVIDLSDKLGPDGRLTWTVPEGKWTIMRFGRRSTGANTRPSPAPGIGLECDKLDKAALDAHFEEFVGTLLRELGPRDPSRRDRLEAGPTQTGAGPTRAGWTMLHIDSWEMGSQNWTAGLRDEFRRRRGYDPLPYLPAVTGRVVDSLEISERFLWDLRQTLNELIVENHAEHLKTLAHRHGFGLSIEPYDLTPCSDLDLGGAADVPMCEFWSNGYGFDTTFSCIEATSIAHTRGRSIVAAESFTADDKEAWRLYPGNMKVQADWALCFGINRLVFHRYAHQPWLDRFPGMTMGIYGVHYERTQTWWGMVGAWHQYLSRCQFMLRRGVPVADILYLAAEGAPHVFRPPPSALHGSQPIPDRRGYNFDGCSPMALEAFTVRDGQLIGPEGVSYRVLVLPDSQTITPALLRRVKALVEAGATIVGPRPVKSPSLSNYPNCDREVQQLANDLWGEAGAKRTATWLAPPSTGLAEHSVGKGKLIETPHRARPAASHDVAKVLKGARWIWKNEGSPAASAPVGSCRFRRTFSVERRDEVASAWIYLTADNGFNARLNDQPVGTGNNFTAVFAFDVRALLRAGENVLTVAADNGGDGPNPAGLIGSLEIRYRDNLSVVVHTDRRWQCAAASGDAWQPVVDLGAWGMAPWGKVGEHSVNTPTPPSYSEYDLVAGLLRRMGVRPDFESDVPLRYIHRRDGEADIYFVANGGSAAVEADCVFRVPGRFPQIWDPVSGTVRWPGNVWKDRRSHVRLSLERQGSAFLVFWPSGKAPQPTGAVESPDHVVALGGSKAPKAAGAVESRGRLATDVPGPWEVRFQPGRGAPAKLTFDTLVDWSRHGDPGVKYFSGEATYATTLKLDAEQLGPKHRLLLDLGRVEVMARVKLNGRDLGVAWTPPFRVDITEAAKAGDNTLEITVANLWPNRLIGDHSLPEAKRVTRTTWNPYRPDSPLLSSGLLGPVDIKAIAKGAD